MRLHDNPISIKTKMYKQRCNHAGVKLSWTVDWDKLHQFILQYRPQSDMVYISIVWGGEGAFHIIKQEAQSDLLNKNGKDWYCTKPQKGTNFRGVEISKEALQTLVNNSSTEVIHIKWTRDRSLLEERALYERWVKLWDTL